MKELTLRKDKTAQADLSITTNDITYPIDATTLYIQCFRFDIDIDSGTYPRDLNIIIEGIIGADHQIDNSPGKLSLKLSLDVGDDVAGGPGSTRCFMNKDAKNVITMPRDLPNNFKMTIMDEDYNLIGTRLKYFFIQATF